ncbi:MAG TPA: hypothetical protein PLP29_01865 [Candidatus Ozemobacteraceae bacterium]|nr:hypothetical protein [Candidatus Ozemobacteraceae bacterium]
MNPFRRWALVLLLAATLLLPAAPAACDTLQILMPSRLNHPSWVLDALRQRFATLLDHEVTLHLLPTTTDLGPVDVASVTLLMIEEGTHLASVPASMRPTPIYFDVFWMLGTRLDLLAPVASAPPTTLAEFQTCLERLHRLHPERFPWFESLEAPLTLFRLRQTMRNGSADPAAALLQKALDRKWLNPFSLESDETLACEVLEAGDAVFSSIWIPASLVSAPPASQPIPAPHESGNEPAAPGWRSPAGFIRFSPFPGEIGPAPVPRIRLRLWADHDDRRWSAARMPPFHPTLDLQDAVFLPCDIPSERLWVKRDSSRFFNRLIEGDL